MHRRTLLFLLPAIVAGCGSDASRNAPAHLEIAEAFALTTIPEATGEDIPFEEAISALFVEANALNNGPVSFIPDFSRLPTAHRDRPITFGWFDTSALQILIEICAVGDASFRFHEGAFQFGTAEDAFFQDPSWGPIGDLQPR